MTTTATTKNAPARSCNSGEGMDRTHISGDEGAVMGIIPETNRNAKTSCAPWCTSHYRSDDDVVHKGRVEVGETYALIERDYEGHEIGVPDNDGFYSPQEARDLAAALTKAADLVEQGEAKKAGQAAPPQTHPDWCDLGPDCTGAVDLRDSRVHEGRGTVAWPMLDDVRLTTSLYHSEDRHPRTGIDHGKTGIKVSILNTAGLTKGGDRIAADVHLTPEEAEHLSRALAEYAKRARFTNDKGRAWWGTPEEVGQ